MDLFPLLVPLAALTLRLVILAITIVDGSRGKPTEERDSTPWPELPSHQN